MQKNLVGLVIVVMCVLSGYAQADKSLVSEDGQFEVVFPAGLPEPKFSTIMQHFDFGDTEAKQYVVENGSGNWTIQYYDHPATLFQSKTADKILSDMLARQQNDPNKKLSNVKNLTVDSFPGNVFDFQKPSGKVIVFGRHATVIAKLRVYHYIFVCLDPAEMNKPDVLKFFSSFHIKKK